MGDISVDLEIPVIAGPTATGKTRLSIELAERVGAEIVSADSRQVYRGLDIGTAKPTVEERRGIPHHFIDELELEVPFSAGRFAAAARERIRSILERGRLPVVVGGSTLYLHALIHGLPDLPEADPDLRHALNQRLAREGGEALYRELQRVDPGFAATLDPTKTQRLVRGLEVYYATGRPLSSFPTTPPEPGFRYRVVVLCRDRKELYARINARVDAMIEAGLVDEVRALAARGYDERINALNTIGYREVFAHLHGEIPFGEMVRLIKRNTRRYAKRQMTWFRRYGFVSYNNGYDLLL